MSDSKAKASVSHVTPWTRVRARWNVHRSNDQRDTSRAKSTLVSFSGAISWFVAIALALSFGATSALSPPIAGFLVFGVGVVTLMALPITFTLVALILTFTIPLTQLSLGVDTRLLAPALLIPLALSAWDSRRAPKEQGQRVALCLVPLCLLGVASLAWSETPLATAAAALALCALVTCLFLIPLAVEASEMLRMMRLLMTGLILASALVALIPVGQLAGRARGIFNNPNALAIMLVLACPFFMRGRWRLLLPIIFILAFTTASRAGAAALMVGIVFYVITARSSGVRVRIGSLLLTAAAVTVAILRLDPLGSGGSLTEASEVSVFRYENSRAIEWSGAIQIWRQHPLIGQGLGGSDYFETGNSFLKLLLDLGLLGLVLALPFLLLLGRLLIFSKNPVVVASTAAALVSCFFEAWLLTAGSAFFVVFCFVLLLKDMEVSDGSDDNSSSHSATRTSVAALRTG